MPARSGPKRPVLHYHGGKFKLAPWICQHLPPHEVYVEPFGGAASVLLHKPRSHAEVYNDLDGDVVNVFRCLQDPLSADTLRRRLYLTPFAREEFEAAYLGNQGGVARAADMIVRSFMGFGSASALSTYSTGFRSNSNRSGTTPARDWANWPLEVPAFVERLRGVVIENREAAEVMANHDGPNTVHYVDPPYVHQKRSGIRSGNHCYSNELNDAQHSELLKFLCNLRGAVVLSGYECALYSYALRDWKVVRKATHADGARARVECLWINPLGAGRLRQVDAF